MEHTSKPCQLEWYTLAWKPFRGPTRKAQSEMHGCERSQRTDISISHRVPPSVYPAPPRRSRPGPRHSAPSCLTRVDNLCVLGSLKSSLQALHYEFVRVAGHALHPWAFGTPQSTLLDYSGRRKEHIVHLSSISSTVGSRSHLGIQAPEKFCADNHRSKSPPKPNGFIPKTTENGPTDGKRETRKFVCADLVQHFKSIFSRVPGILGPNIPPSPFPFGLEGFC